MITLTGIMFQKDKDLVHRVYFSSLIDTYGDMGTRRAVQSPAASSLHPTYSVSLYALRYGRASTTGSEIRCRSAGFGAHPFFARVSEWRGCRAREFVGLGLISILIVGEFICNLTYDPSKARTLARALSPLGFLLSESR